jgi:TRAP-type transport system small permease protein
MLDKFLDLYCSLLGKVIAILLALMVVLVFGNVVLRYGFNSGITVSEELSRWMFVWLTFLGAIIAVREHGHLGTDFLIARLPVIGKKICLVIGYVLMLFMCWLMFRGSYDQSGMVFAVSAGVMLALDFYKLLTGQVKDEDLVNIRESEEQAITTAGDTK